MRLGLFMAAIAALSMSACGYQDRAMIIRGSGDLRARVAIMSANGTPNSANKEPYSKSVVMFRQSPIRMTRADPLLVRGDTLRRSLVVQVRPPDHPLKIAELRDVFSVPLPQLRPDDFATPAKFQLADTSVNSDSLFDSRMFRFSKARRITLPRIAPPPVINIAEIRLALRGSLD